MSDITTSFYFDCFDFQALHKSITMKRLKRVSEFVFNLRRNGGK